MAVATQNSNFPVKANHDLWQNERFPVKANHNLWQDASFPVKAKNGVKWYRWSRNFKVKANNGIAAFGSLKTGNAPSFREKNTKFVIDVYIQTPDLPGNEYIRVPKKYVMDAGIQEGINNPIRGSLVLDNSDKLFTKTTGDFYGLFEKDIFSPGRETRKFIKFVVKIYDGVGNLISTEYYPRLVIEERSGGIELSFTLIDEISHYLSNEVDLKGFIAREFLTGDETRKIFTAYDLTNDYSKNINSEVLVNCAQSENFTYAGMIYTFAAAINERYAVEAINPVYIGDTIRAICNNVIDLQPDNVVKEYFDVQCNFEDWQTRRNIEVLGQTAMSAIVPLIALIPGEYIITPGENTLSLVIQKTKNILEYPVDFIGKILSSKNARGKIQVSPAGLFAFNKINIIKPAESGMVVQSYSGG